MDAGRSKPGRLDSAGCVEQFKTLYELTKTNPQALVEFEQAALRVIRTSDGAKITGLPEYATNRLLQAAAGRGPLGRETALKQGQLTQIIKLNH